MSELTVVVGFLFREKLNIFEFMPVSSSDDCIR
jgi:hypothetical protein